MAINNDLFCSKHETYMATCNCDREVTMPTDWYKEYEDRTEDKEEARRSQVTASSTPEPKPAEAPKSKVVSVDSGSGGKCKHEGF